MAVLEILMTQVPNSNPVTYEAYTADGQPITSGLNYNEVRDTAKRQIFLELVNEYLVQPELPNALSITHNFQVSDVSYNEVPTASSAGGTRR